MLSIRQIYLWIFFPREEGDVFHCPRVRPDLFWFVEFCFNGPKVKVQRIWKNQKFNMRTKCYEYYFRSTKSFPLKTAAKEGIRCKFQSNVPSLLFKCKHHTEESFLHVQPCFHDSWRNFQPPKSLWSWPKLLVLTPWEAHYWPGQWAFHSLRC